MINANQFDTGRLGRWISAACLLLVLVFAGMEAVHAHSALIEDSGTPCLICISAHANAPAIVVTSLPVVFAVEFLMLPHEVEEQSITTRLELFTRPPPLL